MKCPFCGLDMIGEEGSKICFSISCGAYEVNEHNKELPRSKRHDLKKVKK